MADWKMKYVTLNIEDGLDHEDKEYFGYVGVNADIKGIKADLFFTIYNNRLLAIMKDIFPGGNPRYEDGAYLADFINDDDRENALTLISKLRDLQNLFDSKLSE